MTLDINQPKQVIEIDENLSYQCDNGDCKNCDDYAQINDRLNFKCVCECDCHEK